MSNRTKFPRGVSAPPFDSTLLDFLQVSRSPVGVYNLDN